MSLDIGTGTVFANWDIVRLRGERGLGVHRLFVDLKLNGPGGPESAVLTELSLSVAASGAGGAGYIARFQAADGGVIYRVPRHGWESQVSLVADLNPCRVEAIEAIRLGGNLGLKCQARGAVTRQGDICPTLDERHHEVNQGVWIRVLEQMGYGRILLFEVPLPEEADAPRLVIPIKHLEQVQQAMFRGDWRDAVGQTRKVLEALNTSLEAAGDGLEEPNTSSGSKTLSKEARFRRLARILYEIGSLATHADELAQGTEWERRDARAVVAAVAALVSRYGPPKH